MTQDITENTRAIKELTKELRDLAKKVLEIDIKQNPLVLNEPLVNDTTGEDLWGGQLEGKPTSLYDIYNAELDKEEE